MKKNLPYIPYGRQSLDQHDISAVLEVLQSDWLTTGPSVAKFESFLADYTGSRFGVAVSSGTAALHCAMHAIEIGPGDEVIVPTMTFAASANCVVFQGATPVFADVLPESLLLDPNKIEPLITPRTKAIIAVDYAGHPCDYDALNTIAKKHGLFLVADSCHALGAEYKAKKIGSIADLTVFSFHPVKHITTGEGGMIMTNSEIFNQKMRLFRNHGISTDHRQREELGTWQYEMVDLGFNYRLTDFQSALGTSQLTKLPTWLTRRKEIAALYDHFFANQQLIMPLQVKNTVKHAYHLYVIKLTPALDRKRVFATMRQANIGVNVHYLPTHLHPFYQQRFCTALGDCPVAEEAYEHILSLPIHQGLCNDDVKRVTSALTEACKHQ